MTHIDIAGIDVVWSSDVLHRLQLYTVEIICTHCPNRHNVITSSFTHKERHFRICS